MIMAVETTHGHSSHSSDGLTDTKMDMSRGDVELTSCTPPLDAAQDNIDYIHGPRFWLISIAVAIMMFITNLEVPVVITALVAITAELGGFSNASWVVASYLLGYVAVIVILAKFSDLVGRKPVFLLSIAIFIIFSAACSAAQTLTQLIVFRAFQGVGGGGSFSLCTIMVIELVPPEKYTQFVSNISVTNALALLLGPIIGGAIAADTTWRWIFIINVPIAAIAFLISILAIPRGFPYHTQSEMQSKSVKNLGQRSTLNRIDIPGTALLLLATLALTAAFEEADKQFPWKSAYVITLLTVSGVLWIVLLLWERYVTRRDAVREPILPWRFITNRQMMGILLNFVFLGGPTVIGMFIIPQRFQLVYGTSGLQAGVRLIPFTAIIPISSIFASILAGKHKIPPLYIIIAGSCLQVIGFALLGTLPLTLEIPARIYGCQLIAGWGCGMNFALLFVIIPFVNGTRDRAVALGAGAQFRFVGSSMVLAIATSVFNSYARSRLEELLGVSDPDSLIPILPTLSQALQEPARYILAEGYNRQALVLCVSAALQIPASLLMWKKKQLVV